MEQEGKSGGNVAYVLLPFRLLARFTMLRCAVSHAVAVFYIIIFTLLYHQTRYDENGTTK